jgi:hypothetical protein
MLYTFYLKKIIKESRKGYVALLSVLVIGAIGVVSMLSVLLSGVNASKTDLALQQAGSAKVLASSCGEEALQSILETGTTSSSGGLTISPGTCTYVITSQNGQNITVNATGQVGTITSKVKIVIATTTPAILLSSWKEVGDF